MIKPRRVGHATFETPDLEKGIAYYDKFMGLVVAEREKDRAFLATKIGQLVIELNKADRGHCIKLSFKDDKGTTIQLFKDWSYLGKHAQVAGIGPLKLGHVAFFTPDIQRTVSFYEK